MTTTTEPAASTAVSIFQVTHTVGGRGGLAAWSSVTSAPGTAAEAIAFIERQAADAADMGLAEPVTAAAAAPAAPDPTPAAASAEATAAVVTAPDTATPAAADQLPGS